MATTNTTTQLYPRLSIDDFKQLLKPHKDFPNIINFVIDGNIEITFNLDNSSFNNESLNLVDQGDQLITKRNENNEFISNESDFNAAFDLYKKAYNLLLNKEDSMKWDITSVSYRLLMFYFYGLSKEQNYSAAYDLLNSFNDSIIEFNDTLLVMNVFGIGCKKDYSAALNIASAVCNVFNREYKHYELADWCKPTLVFKNSLIEELPDDFINYCISNNQYLGYVIKAYKDPLKRESLLLDAYSNGLQHSAIYLANLYYDNKEFDKAFHWYVLGLNSSFDNNIYCYTLGKLFELSNNKEDKLKYLAILVEQCDSINHLGWDFIFEASKNADQYFDELKMNPSIARNLSLFFWEDFYFDHEILIQHDYGKSLKYALIQLYTSKQTGYYTKDVLLDIAEIYNALGQKEEAIQYFAKYALKTGKEGYTNIYMTYPEYFKDTCNKAKKVIKTMDSKKELTASTLLVDFDLPEKIINVLRKNNIDSIGDLLDIQLISLLSIKGFTKQDLLLITEFLYKHRYVFE